MTLRSINSTNRRAAWLGGAALAGLVLADAPVYAQQSVEEIVVTARKRDEDLQKIPVTATVISSTTIREFDLSDVRDLVSLTPNAFFDPLSGGLDQRITIRGAGSLGVQDFSEQATGIYRNGYYMGGVRTSFSDQVDLERLEVLRGPQGGLYGRNAVGGAVNFVYARPKYGVESGSAEIKYGSFNRFEGRGIVNLPIAGETVAARFAGWFINQEKGEYFNIERREYLDAQRSGGIRGMISAAPSPEVETSFDFEYTTESGTPYASAFDGPISGTQTAKTVRRDTKESSSRDGLFIGNTTTFRPEGLGTITGLLSYRKSSLDAVNDQDFTADQTRIGVQTLDRKETVNNIFAEAHWDLPNVGPFSGIIGFTYFDEDVVMDRRTTSSNPLGAAITTGSANAFHSLGTTSKSGWGEFNLAAADNLDFFASVRYTDERKFLDFSQIVTNPGSGLLQFTLPGLKTRFRNSSLGGGVDWRATPGLTLYARVNDGFRAGGFNTLLTKAAAATLTNLTPQGVAGLLDYKDETSTNYEIGAKLVAFDRKLVLNAAAFRLKQRDVIAANFVPGTFIFIYDNLGRSVTKGLEFDATVVPIKNLSLIGSFGYLEADLEQPLPFNTTVPSGNTTSASLLAVYRAPLSDKLTLRFQGSWRYRDDRSPVRLEGEPIQEYDLLGAGIALEAPRWSIQLSGENLGDNRYLISGSFPAGTPPAFGRAVGRTVTFRLGAKF